MGKSTRLVNVWGLLLITTLTACTQAPPQPLAIITPQPSQTPTPSLTPTPFWGQSLAYDGCVPTCMLDAQGVWTIDVSGLKQNLYFWNGFGNTGRPRKERMLITSSFQADLLVADTDYKGPSYTVVFDLHGFGTVRSWYAQILYVYSDGQLDPVCQAFSYSSDTPRFWKDVSKPIRFDEWHTFKIEVIERNIGWHYGFKYFLDGQEVCQYDPPDKWDGDDRYSVIFQDVEINRDKVSAPSQEAIRVMVRNYYSFITGTPSVTGTPAP